MSKSITTSTIALIAIGGLLTVSSMSGCKDKGPDKALVSGVVTYNDKPVEGATVMFHYDAGKGGGDTTAVTDAEGKYSAEFPVGTAKVSITKKEGGDEKTKSMTAEDMEKMMGAGGGTPPAAPGGEVKNLIPGKYSVPNTSKLSVTVKAGEENTANFPLKD